jgi:small multidrug resistance pump
MHWLALVICVAANVAANFAFKRFVSSIDLQFTVPALINTLLEPSLWIGLMFAGVVLGSYLYAIRGLPLSVAYPAVTSSAIVGIATASAVAFGEPLGMAKIAAIVLIVAGLCLLVSQG